MSGSGTGAEGSTPSGFDIPDVGHFELERGGHGDLFLCEHPRGDGGVIRVLVYPDFGPFDAAYCQRVRETTRHIVTNQVALLAPMQSEVAKMWDSYELPEPASYDDLFRGLKLSHIKFLAGDRVEIIFEECPETGWFSLDAHLDGRMQIEEIWLDG